MLRLFRFYARCDWIFGPPCSLLTTLWESEKIDGGFFLILKEGWFKSFYVSDCQNSGDCSFCFRMKSTVSRSDGKAKTYRNCISFKSAFEWEQKEKRFFLLPSVSGLSKSFHPCGKFEVNYYFVLLHRKSGYRTTKFRFSESNVKLAWTLPSARNLCKSTVTARMRKRQWKVPYFTITFLPSSMTMPL